MTKLRRRNPLVQMSLIALACLLGIGSRRYAHALPWFLAAYAGDTLWALAAFLGIGLILPRASTRKIAILAMTFSVAIELSQLYHAPWIDSIRNTTIGGLTLGFGFLWSDLVCYAFGVGLGVAIEILSGLVLGETALNSAGITDRRKLWYLVGKRAFASLFIIAGISHFVATGFFLKIMPPYLPFHLPLVLVSGVIEIILGSLLLVPRHSRLAAWGIIALLIAVFPANIYVYQHQELFPFPWFLHLLRLPLQGVLVLWAFVYTRR